jgi:hypothetical protein
VLGDCALRSFFVSFFSRFMEGVTYHGCGDLMSPCFAELNFPAYVVGVEAALIRREF